MKALLSEYQNAINIPCDEINRMPEAEIEKIINTVIDHYYDAGFPYYEISDHKIIKDFGYLLGYDIAQLELPNNELQQNMMGLATCNAFHPEMWNVQCHNAKTPMDIFNDRQLFYTALRKRIKYSDTKLAPFNIRKSLKAFGAQGVSNFRPTIAKWVYEKFCPKDGIVLDPCAGYGGRLLGFLSSGAKKYFGVDPNEDSFNGNMKMAEKILSLFPTKKSVELSLMPFEEYQPDVYFDLVFTSPPYFNVEKYDDFNKTQSYVRYPEYDLWVNGFLKTLIERSHMFLKKGGHFVINTGSPITQDVERIASECFGCLPTVYSMRLSKILGNGEKVNKSHKTEPIFVWKK